MFKKAIAVSTVIVCLVISLIGCAGQSASGTSAVDKGAAGEVAGEAGSGAAAKKISSAGSKPFPVFETVDLDGNAVTNEIFAEKDLTVINIWGTFCGPCVREMPELAQWDAELPENVQIIGLVLDIGTILNTKQVESTKQILEEAGVKYPNLVTKAPDFSEFVAELVGIPTTIFVDKDGNIVGKSIVGAKVKACQTFVEEYLDAQQ